MDMPKYPVTVTLKDDREVVIRLLQPDDRESLYQFFRSLPEEDRIFFRHDVTDPEIARKWTEEIDLTLAVPLVALDGDEIIGDATLHLDRDGWMQHVGSIRIATATTHRSGGLGTFMTCELVKIAESKGLEKLRANLIENDEGSVKMLQAAGFEINTVLNELARDRQGRTCNVTVMVNYVANLSRIIEDWMHDAVIPAYRVPGGGHG